MLRIETEHRFRDCDGVSRRDFMRIGGFGLEAVGLPQLLTARARTAEAGVSTKDTSVVWLWLAGGATHVETFDPKMTAPSEYRSVTGEVKTPLPGVTVGGTFPQIAKCVDKMALVRSFAHRNSGHGGGTHWLMTGYNNKAADNGGVPNRPSLGSILARHRGPNNLETGMPTYIRFRRIRADGPAFLGSAFEPFNPGGEAKNDMTLRIERKRLQDRRHLLGKVDRLRNEVDATGLVEGYNGLEQQAFDVVLGKSAQAFDHENEDAATRELYGDDRLGEQMLTARRLCEAGCGFVTISTGGWDMHRDIEKGLKRRSPRVDRAVSAFVQDIHQRGLDKDILLVVTGEFGRTPRVNRRNGRDHWAPLSTLALSGGGLNMGQVVGESAAKVDVPRTDAVHPQDLMATIFHVLGIPQDQQYKDHFGRPVYMLDEGKPIAELV